MDTTLPLEIVVRILDCLPGWCLRVCRCVCKSWKEASNIILSKKGRQNLRAASFIGQLKCSKFLTVVKNYFHFAPLPIHAVVYSRPGIEISPGGQKVVSDFTRFC